MSELNNTAGNAIATNAAASNAIVVENLKKEVSTPEGPKTVLGPVSFAIKTGSFTVISGRSGAGKTTLLSILGLLDPLFAGQVALFDQPLLGLSESQRAHLRNQGLGFVFQIPRLFSGMSVWQNLTATAWIGGQAIDAKRAHWLLERVGLAHFRQRVGGLSGGERQRLTVARALLKKPRLLLCDEPTGNLDRQTGEELLNLISELAVSEQVTVVMVSHDPAVIGRGQQRLELASGQLSHGSPTP